MSTLAAKPTLGDHVVVSAAVAVTAVTAATTAAAIVVAVVTAAMVVVVVAAAAAAAMFRSRGRKRSRVRRTTRRCIYSGGQIPISIDAGGGAGGGGGASKRRRGRGRKCLLPKVPKPTTQEIVLEGCRSALMRLAKHLTRFAFGVHVPSAYPVNTGRAPPRDCGMRGSMLCSHHYGRA